MARTLEQMDQITLQLKYDWEKSHSTLKLDQLKQHGLYAGSPYAIVAILDKNGRPLTASAPFPRLRKVDSTQMVLRHCASTPAWCIRYRQERWP